MTYVLAMIGGRVPLVSGERWCIRSFTLHLAFKLATCFQSRTKHTQVFNISSDLPFTFQGLETLPAIALAPTAAVFAGLSTPLPSSSTLSLGLALVPSISTGPLASTSNGNLSSPLASTGTSLSAGISAGICPIAGNSLASYDSNAGASATIGCLSSGRPPWLGLLEVEEREAVRRY